MEEDSLKYIGAAWKKGSLDELHSVFLEEMTPQEFRIVFVEWLKNFEAGWVFLAETDKGIIPVGFCTAWVRGRIIEIADIVWFSWASRRNVWESAVNFYDSMRKKVFDDKHDPADPMRYFVVLEYAMFRDKRFFERMADRGIMRKIGHIHDIYPDEVSVMFQTKTPVRGKNA